MQTILKPDRTLLTPVLRPLEEGDLEACLAIEGSTFEHPWPRPEFVRCLRRPAGFARVARHEGRLVGYCLGLASGRRVSIENLAVAAEARRHGIGLQLLEDALGPAERRSIGQALVSEVNLGAQLFFRRMGWRCVRVVPAAYDSVDLAGYLFIRRAGSKEA